VESGISFEDLADGRYLEVKVAFKVLKGEISIALLDFYVESSYGKIENSAPKFTSNPVVTATSGTVYSYDIYYLNSDYDELIFSLDQAPDGMSVDNNGLVTWLPLVDQAGEHSVSIRMTDEKGAFVLQQYSVFVE